ncbi:MAG: DUF5723 family protein [Candidatus Cloacimonetes bacterium]|nr:DUF5723 family protein [Candidatus Cloacimonadota bacterium]MDD2684040.1 DUF5723 family protein [Candidatus Cloacimonadota bacterium]MDD3097161.1 DUF5723 family protein [Candidatus Cloacimonadota bacterium]MDD3577532.1 DUF5723 family protein [Candidatus Cloacimonadota bacterium]MDD4035475.1 DUF5723 family protein [Candidatus Cloacimonadota bacterium]
MKKLILLLLLGWLCSLAFAMTTAKSLFYADSYMLRAEGVEASYWNPARLRSSRATDLWLPGLNSAVSVSNNALDLDTYNYFVSRDTLHAVDKEHILRNVKGKLSLSAESSISIFGFTMGNTALSSSTRIFAKSEAQEDILRLALYGNTEDSYSFNKASNNVSATAYSDISYGFGDLKVPFIPPELPEIKAGFSVSALIGLGDIQTRHFTSEFSTDPQSGTNASLEAVIRSSNGGIGFKSMLGLYSKVTPQMELGLTLDNIFGNIVWLGAREEREYQVKIDSLFVTNFDDDFYDQTDETRDIDSYSSTLPMELRLAGKYDLGFMDLSADWVQGFKESAVTNATGRLSIAAGLKPLPFLPLGFGISLPNSQTPLKTSYSIGISSKMHEFAIAVQSYNSLIPGYKSKGVSVGTSMRFWF